MTYTIIFLDHLNIDRCQPHIASFQQRESITAIGYNSIYTLIIILKIRHRIYPPQVRNQDIGTATTPLEGAHET